MKTKPISFRFDETDLLLATNKSGIKKPQKLFDFLLSEYVRDLKPQFLSLPADYVQYKKVGILKEDGSVAPLTFQKPQKKESKSMVDKLESNITYQKSSKEAYDGKKEARPILDEVGTWQEPTNEEKLPERLKGESSIDYQIRISEFYQNQK